MPSDHAEKGRLRLLPNNSRTMDSNIIGVGAQRGSPVSPRGSLRPAYTPLVIAARFFASLLF